MPEKMSDQRPWGKWEIINLGNSFKVKKIIVNPGERLSLQRHKKRKENWTVVKNTCHITLNDRKFDLKVGETVIIEPNDIHRVENKGTKKAVFIEVQTGDYLGEDDIERLEDDYNRI
jgi:mannose-6-phosphate isomerase-like protein (cupin superfamily)